MGHGVHAEGHFLLWVLVKLLPHCKCLGNHLTLLDPLRFIVAAANYPDTETQRPVGQGKPQVKATTDIMRGRKGRWETEDSAYDHVHSSNFMSVWKKVSN